MPKAIGKDIGDSRSETHKIFDYDSKNYPDRVTKVVESFVKYFPNWEEMFDDDDYKPTQKNPDELLNLFCRHLLKYPFMLKSLTGVSHLDVPPSKIFEKLTDKSIESALSTTNLIVQLSNCFSEELKFMFATELSANWLKSHGSKSKEFWLKEIDNFKRDAKDLSIPSNYIGTYLNRHYEVSDDDLKSGLNRYRDEILQILTLLPIDQIYRTDKDNKLRLKPRKKAHRSS